MAKLVLIADDAAAVRDVLRDAIEELYRDRVRAGTLTVQTAENGEAVIVTCAVTTPDLVILDVNMPGLDGIDTFYRLRVLNPAAAARVVFLTGVAGSKEVNERLEQASADGALGVMLKPTDLAHLKAMLARHVFHA